MRLVRVLCVGVWGGGWGEKGKGTRIENETGRALHYQGIHSHRPAQQAKPHATHRMRQLAWI